MDLLQVLLTSGLAGVISGFVVSIPVGPINITIVNEGARRGFFWAFMIGLGAMAMDLIYCSIAFAGFSSLFASRFMKATMELLSFLFLIYLGIKYLITASLPATTPTVEAVEHKLHPHTAFWIGFAFGQRFALLPREELGQFGFASLQDLRRLVEDASARD